MHNITNYPITKLMLFPD